MILSLDEVWFTVRLPLTGTPLFFRVADRAIWHDWDEWGLK
jgi:hypothetical protein